MSLIVYIRGGGDLASGVALRLQRAGLRVLITELSQPLVVRRMVSFADAVFKGHTKVEQVTARRVEDLPGALSILEQGEIPVLVDPQAKTLPALRAALQVVLVDGRMLKKPPEYDLGVARLVVGLGPGFVAGENCHAVIETHRGHFLGRVIWQGPSQADTGAPESVARHGVERVLRAPAEGPLVAHAAIGDHLEAGDLVAEVAGEPIVANFRGVLRGLVYPGLHVWEGLKVGDVDPRNDPRYCTLVSDKSLAIGGGVLEAILSCPELRPHLWEPL